MVEGEFGPSDTLSTVLAKESFGSAAGAVTRALSKLVDPKLIRPGEHYAVIRDDEGAATSFEYAPTPVLRYVVAPEARRELAGAQGGEAAGGEDRRCLGDD